MFLMRLNSTCDSYENFLIWIDAKYPNGQWYLVFQEKSKHTLPHAIFVCIICQLLIV